MQTAAYGGDGFAGHPGEGWQMRVPVPAGERASHRAPLSRRKARLSGHKVKFSRRKTGRLTVAAGVIASALAGTAMVGAPPASASATETVIVTSTGLLSPVTA